MSEKERPQLIIDYEANTDKLVRLGDVVDQFKGCLLYTSRCV